MLGNLPFSMSCQKQVNGIVCTQLECALTCVNILDLGKAANFPYATINPEEARIPVPDARFDWLCEVYKPASRVPAHLTCIDIAGLTAVCEKSLYRPYLN